VGRCLLVELPRSHETGEFPTNSSYKNNSSINLPINIVDDELPPVRTKPAEYYGAVTPPTNPALLPQPQQQQQQQNQQQNFPTYTNFNPVDINSFSLPTTPPMMYPSGASSPMSMNSDMMMNLNMMVQPGNLSPTTVFPPGLQNLQNFSSSNSSPIGPYQNTSLPLEIQQQNMTQQFTQLSAKNEVDVFKEAMGRVSEVNQAKSHFSEKNAAEEEKNSVDEKQGTHDSEQDSNNGNSTPISDKLASDEMD